MVVKAVSSLSLSLSHTNTHALTAAKRGSHWRGQKSIRRNGLLSVCLNQRAEVWRASFLMKAAIPASFTCAAFPSEAGENGSCVCQGHSNGQESDLNVKLLVQRLIVFKVYWTLQDRNELSCHVFKGKFTQKWHFGHLFTLMSFQTCVTLFPLWNTKRTFWRIALVTNKKKGVLRIDPLCSTEKRKSYGFGTTWGWENVFI